VGGRITSFEVDERNVMGKPSELVGDVIAGNLAGAEANVAATQARISELEVELAAHEQERAEYVALLKAHEKAVRSGG
jgi:hypothetical protein